MPRRYLDKYLLPKLGRFPASDITPADVARLLDELKGARRLLDAGGAERPRSRAPSSNEIAQLFAEIRETPNFGGDNLLAIKLLLALCVRKGELLGARWAEFDLDGTTAP